MAQRLAGRAMTATVAVLLALFHVIDIASKALAPYVRRVRAMRALSRLFGMPPAPGAPPRWASLLVPIGLGLLCYAFGLGAENGIFLGVATAGNFPDVLDARFAKIHNDRYKQLPDMIARFFTIVGPGQAPQKQDYRTSSVGTFGDVPEFTGSVTFDDVYEGYDGTITPREYATGFQIQRRLFDDAQYGIMDGKPRGMATALQRTRQKHAAQVFNNAFNLDTTWNNFTENVPLCSNSHTTRSGASTASGFDNLITTAFSAVALTAARIQMRGFRGDRGERISVNPTTIIHPIDIYDLVWEVTKSEGKPDVSTNNANVHAGVYTAIEWEYLTDTNNWFLADETMMKDGLHWFERLAAEFAMVEDFDTLVGKWREYSRYGHGHDEWRGLLGAQVS